jgi:hypothetical protein
MSIFLLHVCMNRLLYCKIVTFTFTERWPCVGRLLRSWWCRTIPGSLYGPKGGSHAQTGLVCVTHQLFARLPHHVSPRRWVGNCCDTELRSSAVHCTILVRITLQYCGILSRYIWYRVESFLAHLVVALYCRKQLQFFFCLNQSLHFYETNTRFLKVFKQLLAVYVYCLCNY